MYRNAPARLFALIISAVACLLLGGALPLAGQDQGSRTPTVGFATRHGKSARLSDYKVTGPIAPRPNREIHNDALPRKGSGAARATSDPVAQKQFGLSQPEQQIQFEGLSDDDNANVVGFRIVPPDTEGDVGPNHYIQYINDIAVIYDKSGNIVLGPFPGNAFWAGLGGPCEFQNDGDPLVKYDRQADRWVFSQFALPNFPDGPFYQCFAVSKTNDPTGEYWQYEFKTSDDFFTDYGKIGIWPDAYYMTFNMFGPSSFQGGAYAFDRNAMLAGAPAARRRFRHGARGRRAAVGPRRADAAARRLAELLPDVRGRPGAAAPLAVPRGLDESRRQHLHGARRDPGRGVHLPGLRRPARPVRSPARLPGEAGDPRRARDVSPGVPQFRRPRVARRQPDGRDGGRRIGRALVRGPQPGRRSGDLPAGDLRARRELPLDGLDRHGRQRQHGPRLLEVERDDAPRHRRDGTPGRRPARHDGRGGHLVRRRRKPGVELEPLGRLQHDVHRPDRRLHVLVHAAVLRHDRQLQFQDAHRLLPLSELHERPLGDARGHGDGRVEPPRGSDRLGDALGHPPDRGGSLDDDDRRLGPLPVPDTARRVL